MVSRPEQRDDIRSFPALAVTMVLCAPDTAGPWSAVTIRHISMNLLAYCGNLNENKTIQLSLRNGKLVIMLKPKIA